MKGAFVTNRYYSDAGTKHAYFSIKQAFGPRAQLDAVSPVLVYDKQIRLSKFDYDFAIFWNKDILIASAIQKLGIRVFNPPEVLDICDDKQKTYMAINGVDIPKTISAPLMYDVNTKEDSRFLTLLEDTLKFPMIAKQNIGSQGRQVHRLQNKDELKKIYQALKHTPHHYQEAIGEYGSDIRIYTVGGKVISACKRQGTDYRSNLAAGGTMELIQPKADYISAAESISKQINLDFGTVDFLIASSPIFLEVNSNAYFTGIEGLGADIGGAIANYVLKVMDSK